MNCIDKITYYSSKLVSYCLYVIAIVMVITVPSIHIIKILPFYFDYYPIPIALFITCFLSTTLIFSAIIYFRGVREPFLPVHDASELQQFVEQGFNKNEFEICSKCNSLKPFRCHHCSKCNRCVYRMDHHCAWFGGCVGSHNIRFFFSFLVSLGTTSLLAALSFIPMKKIDDMTRMTFIIETIIGLLLVGYALYHYVLLRSNQTTLEITENLYRYLKEPSAIRKYVLPYDLGVKKNLKQALRYNKPIELLNPFAKMTPINEMKVIISKEFDDHFDEVEDYYEKESKEHETVIENENLKNE